MVTAKPDGNLVLSNSSAPVDSLHKCFLSTPSYRAFSQVQRSRGAGDKHHKCQCGPGDEASDRVQSEKFVVTNRHTHPSVNVII